MSPELPSPDQVNTAITHTTVAINAAKQAWSDWAPIISAVSTLVFVQIPAMSKNVQNIPVIGSLWNYVAGNWGHAANKQ